MHTDNFTSVRKPYPWRCTNCLEKTVRGAVVDYVAIRWYRGVEYTVKVDALQTPKCENCGQVSPDIVALIVIERAFAAEFRTHWMRETGRSESEIAASLRDEPPESVPAEMKRLDNITPPAKQTA